MILSRTAVARLLVEQPSTKYVKQAAAWLIATGQTRRSGELLHEVARLRAEHGHLWVKVTTASPMTEKSKHRIEQFLKAATHARTLEVETRVSPDVIGGVLIETAGQELDTTVAGKLQRFVREAAV